MHVLELNDPRALTSPGFVAFLERAIPAIPLLAPVANLVTIADELFQFVNSPDHFMIVGSEDGEFHSLVFGFFGTSPLFPYPTIVGYFNDGSAELRKATSAKLMDILLARGYTKAIALNGTGHRDDAWVRTLAAKGATAKSLGSLMLFEVE